MKTLNTYILSKIKNKANITEKLRINKSNLKKGTELTLFPKNLDELSEMVGNEVFKNGNECDLNHIDTSKITDMNNLFYFSDFNGDISEWDVSNVTNMYQMFWKSEFNGDLSKWDVSSVENMSGMFDKSNFNNDSICDWDVSNVTDMTEMFYNCNFNQDISKWKINPNCDTNEMFTRCHIKDKYKPFQNGERL